MGETINDLEVIMPRAARSGWAIVNGEGVVVLQFMVTPDEVASFIIPTDVARTLIESISADIARQGPETGVVQ